MTEAEAVEAMMQRWVTGWEALHPPAPHADHIPVCFEGEHFDSEPTWARVSIIHTVRNQLTTGPDGERIYESRGHIFVNLFAPVGQGTKTISAMRDDVRTVLEGKSLGQGLNTYEGAPGESRTDGRWITRTATVPFRYTALA